MQYRLPIIQNGELVPGTYAKVSTDNTDLLYLETHVADKCNLKCRDCMQNPELSLMDNFLWNGIYRRKFMETIRFNETEGAAFRDIDALFQIVSRAEKGVYVNHLVYHYRQDNGGASSYNKKSFSYVATEYRYIERFVKKLSVGWEEVYFLKMAGHSIDRLRFMAASGEYWEESKAGIDELCERLRYAVKQGIINEENCPEWHSVQMFIENPYSSFLIFQSEYQTKLRRLHGALESIRGHSVYIFGAGKYGMFFRVCLALAGIEVSAYCDNDEEKRKQQRQAIPIISPEEAVMKEPNAYYVVAVQKYVQEITGQLSELGIEKSHILIYDSGMDVHLLRALQK